MTNSVELGHEGPGMEIVGGALLEVEDAQEAHHQQHARRDAEHHVGDLKRRAVPTVSVSPDEDQLDHQRGKQGEGSEVVQKGEHCGHWRAPVAAPWAFYFTLRLARGAGSDRLEQRPMLA